jgi:hypothetical protein
MERVRPTSMEKLSPKRPSPAQLTRYSISGDSSDKADARESLPSAVDRSKGKNLQGVDRLKDTALMASSRLETIQIPSRPLESSMRQNSAPMPDEAPVTTAMPDIRSWRRLQR